MSFVVEVDVESESMVNNDLLEDMSFGTRLFPPHH